MRAMVDGKRFDDGESQSDAITPAAASFEIEERLRISEAHLSAVLESVSECFYALDSDWRFTVFNRASEEYFGVSRHQILGQRLWDVFPQGIGMEYERCCRAAMQDGISSSFISPSIYRPGRFGDLRIVPMQGGGIAVSIRDITDRKAAEDRVRESEHELQILTDALPVLISYIDSQERYRFVNKAYEDWFGRSRDEILGRSVREVVGDAAYDIAKPMIERALAGERFSDERFMPYKDGGGREVSLGYVPRISADGQAEGYYVLVQEIGERKRAERALTELTATLEQRVRETIAERDRIWNNARDLLLVIGDDGILRAVNPAWTTSLGWRQEELTGRSYAEFLHPDDVRASANILAALPKRILPPFETRMRTKDGRYRTVAWVGVPEDGLIYASGRDVTEDNAHQAELEIARAQLTEMQKMDTIGQLSGGIAHDFNNLLTPIVGSLDMLYRKYQDDERSARMVSGALQAAERAKVLVSRLLTFARRQHLEAQPVDVASLADGMFDLVQRTIGPQIEVTTEIAANLPPAQVDPHQLELALLNMCVNARDAMPGGGKLTIAADQAHGKDANIPLPPDAQFVRVCITDNGHGMDAETLRRSIEPFYSTKGVGKGTGLGLSMVHGLAVQSGGGLAIASTPGEGTTVTIWLPVATDAAAIGQIAKPKVEEIVKSRPLSVLLVDDEDLVLHGNAEMLESLGHKVTRLQSGIAAINALQQGGTFDLLLTDQMMPNMTGLQLIDQARRIQPRLAAGLITGFAANVDGGDGIARLAKPFRLADLARFVEKLMG